MIFFWCAHVAAGGGGGWGAGLGDDFGGRHTGFRVWA